ncbi:hypothetical protein F4809DRAFT_651212 [Biscogniauxia mediterranea]|nr:hypothetical protein F4809DRAFT_651212 [Biscogniauxia mediterranea]
MGGPFALSVPGYKLGVHTRRHKKLNEERQASQSPSLSPSPSLPDVPSSSLPSGSINPLSHTPDTLRQFAVAGLSPEEELPSKLYPSFPHKPLPPEYPSGSREKSRRINMSRTSAGEGENKRETTVQQHSARLKHLNTMTAIMHRCLNGGDISRAKRAFGLLVQTKEIDIRLNNLWAIGSEILMRAPETAQSDETSSTNDGDSPLPAPLPRWGSAANVEKVKDYFENLIQQYPHDPYRPHLTSAIDFWPALFGIEVYNINAEFQRALYQLDTKGEEEVDAEMDDEFGEMEEEYSGEDLDERRQRKEDARLEALWAAKDEVRQKTQVAAQHIATRMDQLMENAPYATHHELLHLRGNVSLFIADLYLPARLVETGDAIIVERMEVLSLRDRDLRAHLNGAEDHLALGNRREEQDKARSFFQRILDNGGEVSSWIRKFMDSEDHEHDIGLAEAGF